VRSEAKTQQWAKKHAAQAAAQLKGALSTLGSRRFWCEHPRRSRVDFKPGELEPIEAIAAVEAGAGGEIVRLPKMVTLFQQGVPFSYLSVNDLLNLIFELRSFPELETYFAARAVLPDDTRHTIGGECLLYGELSATVHEICQS
jgi:hypothetical protein